jgi:eukaryotic-like serine/threonine-protein kinase
MQGLLLAGRYRLADCIGSGGMGRVWRAHDEVLHRAVAIKELTAALYVSESERDLLLARTRAEARAAARINHSAVVTVHDVLEHDGRPWIVMELVEGHSLADAVKEKGRLEPREAARIGLWVLRALRAAHGAGVLHRDIKPGNVLLGHDGRVLLTDFGIAQIEGDTTITRTGEVVGSVDFLAPERVRGQDPGPASDLWALGATLYTAVDGRSPFRRTSPLSTMQAVVEEEIGEPQHADALGPVITALLRKDPATRPDAAETEQMLAEAVEGRRPSAAQAYVPTQCYDTSAVSRAEAATAAHGAHGTRPAPGAHASPTRTTAAGPGTGSQAAAGPGGPGATVADGPRTQQHAAPPTPRRRRLRAVALAVVLAVAVAALAAGVTAAVLQQDGGGTPSARPSSTPEKTDTSASSTRSPSPSPSGTGAANTLPTGWVRYDDERGYSLALPGVEWTRTVYDAHQTDYSPDGGKHFIRISVDSSSDFSSPYDHQSDLEQQLERLVDYQRVTLQENTYRDRPGSVWEYTWTAQVKDTEFPGPRHATEETYFSRDGVEYAIYMSSPAADWATTSQQFKTVLQSWRPDGG